MWIFGLLDPTAHKLDRCELFFLKTRLLRCLCEKHRYVRRHIKWDIRVV